jgi:hypothetical protein
MEGARVPTLEETLTILPASAATSTFQASGVVKATVESGSSRKSLLPQLAAIPATVAGTPPHDPTGSSRPSASTAQP